MRRRRYSVLAIFALGLAAATLLQPFGYNQGGHLALVRALADGTPTIDRYNDFTGDAGYYHGHLYSNKAPGLAFATVPVYVALRALGLPRGVHVLSLWGVILPAMILLLLVRRVGDEFEPGFGTAAALTLGLGTLVLPFSTLFFAHVLSAALAFAAFAVLWSERRGPPRIALVAAAGVLAGLAVTTEYPLALAGLVLGLYAIARARFVARGLAYAAGVAVGIAPLLAFNQWAFGSITHLSYSTAPTPELGAATAAMIKNPSRGFFGIELPEPRVVLELLFSARGLLTLAPVVAGGALAVVLVYRRRRRAEALVVAGVVLLFLSYDAGFIEPFGGWGPGPRYLIGMLPFLGFPLALAYRRLPITTLLLALASAALMTTATATEVLLPNNTRQAPVVGDIADTGRWLDRLSSLDFTDTALGHGLVGIAPFAILLAAAAVLAVLATPRPELRRREVEAAVVALAGWLVLFRAGPMLLHADRSSGGALGAVAVALTAALVILTAVRVHRSGALAALAAAPLAALAAPGVRHHPGWCLGLAVAALALTAAVEQRALRAALRACLGGRRQVPARARP
jgi:hypothetical protein